MKRLTISLIMVLSGLKVGAQWGPYQKQIDGLSQDWQRIEIPYHLFDSLKEDLADIRLYAVTKAADTLVVPYYLTSMNSSRKEVRYPVQIINRAQTPDGWSFTLKVDSVEITNRIELELPDTNFHWQVEVAGSNDQQDWAILLKDYPLVGIQNQWASYKFTDINFNPARFGYYRVLLRGDSNPRLLKANLIYEHSTRAEFYKLSLDKPVKKQDLKDGRVFLDYETPMRLPVSALNIKVSDTLDYHRRFEVWYSQFPSGTDLDGPALDDYRYLSAGVLSSTRANYFHFTPQRAKQLKLVIYEQDNQPLNITSLEIMYEKQYLVARFPKAQYYYFTFGDQNITAPKYDLVHFKQLKDSALPLIQLGQNTRSNSPHDQSISRWWLWLVLGVSMLVIGSFTWQLLVRENKELEAE